MRMVRLAKVLAKLNDLLAGEDESPDLTDAVLGDLTSRKDGRRPLLGRKDQGRAREALRRPTIPNS